MEWLRVKIVDKDGTRTRREPRILLARRSSCGQWEGMSRLITEILLLTFKKTFSIRDKDVLNGMLPFEGLSFSSPHGCLITSDSVYLFRSVF